MIIHIQKSLEELKKGKPGLTKSYEGNTSVSSFKLKTVISLIEEIINSYNSDN